MALYRLFVDEVGNHDMHHCRSSNERFLTLFGVITEDGDAHEQVVTEMRVLKEEFFGSNSENPLILHRADIAGMKRQFRVMTTWDETKKKAFNDALLACYKRWQYVALVVTIDKAAHLDLYGPFHHEPYYYCMKVLLERYVMFLNRRKGRGDVMFESRNRVLDEALRRDFYGLQRQGTKHIAAEVWQERLTSPKLKLVAKAADIAGLQLADMLAHSAHYDVLVENNLASKQSSQHGIRVTQVLRSAKYDRKWGGKIQGYGMKLLP